MLCMRVTEKDEQTRREIEHDIDQHLQAVINLRRRLNTLIPINRLPPELLATIFSFCQDGHWYLNSQPNSRHIAMALRWIITAGVCHHWREVALQTPRLWARVDLDYPVFARECSLVLAKHSPLYVTAHRWNTEQRAMFNVITSNTNLIHSIDLETFQFAPPSGGLDPIPPATFPLRSIRISNTHSSLSTFPNVFEKCEFPAIQKLELEGCIGNLPSCLLGPTLVHMKIIAFFEFIDPAKFTHCLSQMPRLQSLHIQGLSFRKETDKGVPVLLTKKILLPSLHQLVLQPPSREEEDYVSLLKNLKMPIVTRTRFMFPYISVQDLSGLLHAVLETLHSFTFHSLSLCVMDGGFIVGLFENPFHPSVLEENDLDPPFDIWLPISSQIQRILWDGFLHFIYLHRIETIHLDIDTDDTDDWRRLLLKCHHLKNLSIVGKFAPQIVKLLHETEEIKADDGSMVSQLIVPELETIYLANMIWRSWAHEDDELTDNLVSVVKERKEAGFPIEKVVIKRCTNMYRSDVDMIQGAGVEAEWDGNIDIEDPEYEETNFDYDDDDDDRYEVQPEDLFDDDELYAF
ncbi:hypothetical protein QCA50_020813 [Cerrena zonata]|uniref:F-box domain-containing protein n=1 Tax=Cerrena zonata TaxID=2478898 RepID=A0AAW0FFB9_9APHY